MRYAVKAGIIDATTVAKVEATCTQLRGSEKLKEKAAAREAERHREELSTMPVNAKTVSDCNNNNTKHNTYIGINEIESA